MAIAIDAVGTLVTGGTSLVTSFTWTGITVGSLNNRALWVSVGLGQNTAPTGVTAHWDSTGTNQSMSLLASIGETSDNANAYIFGLAAPTSGNKTLSVSWTNTNRYVVDAISFAGVDQVTPFSNANTTSQVVTASGTVLSLGITSAPGNMAVVGFVTNNLLLGTAVAGTLAFEDNTNVGTAGLYLPGVSGTTTLQVNTTFTAPWVAAGVNVNVAKFDMNSMGMCVSG